MIHLRNDPSVEFAHSKLAGADENILHRLPICGIAILEANIVGCVSGSLANRDIVADGEPMKRFEDEFPTEWSLSPDGPDRELGQPPADNKEVNTVEQPVKPLILAAGASGQPAW